MRHKAMMAMFVASLVLVAMALFGAVRASWPYQTTVKPVTVIQWSV